MYKIRKGFTDLAEGWQFLMKHHVFIMIGAENKNDGPRDFTIFNAINLILNLIILVEWQSPGRKIQQGFKLREVQVEGQVLEGSYQAVVGHQLLFP